ncbi:MAG: acyltransferase, partial [Planctomycetes bacterium]|nr:acyltransferase [Planctomycetota bacterium]
MRSCDPRYVTLDHWRGVAALAVMVFHGFGAIRGAALEAHFTVAWLQKASGFGWFGVHLFFVISGYCIAANTCRLTASGHGARSFFKDRLLRVYPVYWAACILAVMVGLAALPFNRGSLAGTVPGSVRALLGNVFLLEPYLRVDPLLLVSWSLVFEVGFYLLVAIGIALRQLGASLWLLFGAAFILGVVGLAGVHPGPLYVLKFWPEFLCGCSVFLALWMRGRYRLWSVFVAVPPLFALLAFLGLEDQHRVVQMGGAALFAIVLWALHPFDRQLAEWRILRWLANVGVISYS